ncbi:hypothetical protein SH1V18_11660 [Vallitalea longa]|uniref:SLH domain-containing protein n=1 Tax=Vallitalea longa TaxID=2936439 RepID=A0A9W5Y9P7_9FIRM|nr:S-layer homology domain-containing protein [Vallitalea longa]GKX28686.1 hypothetical protein SH1V18_11660 [Vallitalea longa]
MRKKIYKTTISILLMIIFVIPNVTLAVDDETNQDFGDALYTLKILRGDGKDYNLSGQLKRSEAAAFLIRLLGVEKKVVEDKERYIIDNFTDVDGDQWYSYYVGYAYTAKLIDGYDDNTFRPDDYVSEKEFVKMVLSALNYRQGIDYEWDNIYQFANSIGLLDKTYKYKKEDNNNYLREDTINLMYQSLNIKINNLDKNITEKLIDREYITIYQALEAGVLVDEVKTAIESAKGINANTIKVTLSEEINELSKDNIKIYEEEEDKSEKLNVKFVETNKNVITITTEKQTGTQYTLELIDVEDLNGFVTESVKSDFKGYVEKVVKSDYFKISRVKAISKNVINVYFTQPITESATLPIYYSLKQGKKTLTEGDFKDLAVSRLTDVNNGISIFLKDDSLQEGLEYTLAISGKLTSYYTVNLNDGSGDKMTFMGTESANQQLHISNVETVNNDCIIVTFNKDIDEITATDEYNYKLKDKDGNYTMDSALRAVLVGSGQDRLRKVKLKYVNIEMKNEYILTVDGVKDSFKQMKIKEEKYPIYRIKDNEFDIKVQHVLPENGNIVNVYFSGDISTDIYNADFYIDGIDVVEKRYSADESNKVVLFVDSEMPLQNNVSYTLRIMNICDEFGEPYDKTLEKSFKGSAREFGSISMSECKFIGEDTVYVRFNKYVSSNSNFESQFRLIDKNSDKEIEASNVTYISDNEVVVDFSSTSKNKSYKLVIDYIEDYSEQFSNSDLRRTVERNR